MKTNVAALIAAAVAAAPSVKKFGIVEEVEIVRLAAQKDWDLDDLRACVIDVAATTVADGDYAAENGDASRLSAERAFEAGEGAAFMVCLFEVFGLGDPDPCHWREAREAYVARLEEIDG